MKTRPIIKSDGTLYGHAIRCPACDDYHVFACKVDAGKAGWSFNGDRERPTFSPSMYSVARNAEMGLEEICHSFVRDGRIEYLSDCTHAMAGKTVDLPEVEP